MIANKVANVKIHTMNEKEEIIKEIRTLLDKLEQSNTEAKSAEGDDPDFVKGRPASRPK